MSIIFSLIRIVDLTLYFVVSRDIYGFLIEESCRLAYFEWLSGYTEVTDAQKETWNPLFEPSGLLKSSITRESINVDAVRRGIDSKHRGALWKLFCGVDESIKSYRGTYQSLLSQNISRQSPAIFQIDKDVPRTFPHISDNSFTEV